MVAMPRDLHDLELSDHRVPVHRLVSQMIPSATVKTGLRSSCSLVLPDEEGGDVPVVRCNARRWTKCRLQTVVSLPGRMGMDHRPERVDHDDAGLDPFHVLDDPGEDGVEIVRQHLPAQVPEVHILPDRAARKTRAAADSAAS